MLPNKQRVWLWSINFFNDGQEYLECGSSAKTIKDFRPYKSRNALRKAYQQDVGNSDLKIPDAYWSFLNEVSVGDIVAVFDPKKGNGKQYHLLHGWGIITSDCVIDETNENPMRREVQWYNFFKIPKQNEEMGNSLFFQGTTDEQALHIKELLNINTDRIMESKYQKYIDLLETNKNLILTGAPGTGKTYMAKQIAAEILGIYNIELLENNPHFGFVQFHPSYDYTDFVEGLRPKNDKNGVMGFERKNGVFKEFCKKSMVNPKNENLSVTDEEALASFKNDLKEKGTIEIPSYLNSSSTRTVILKESGSIGVQGETTPSYSDERILKYMKDKDRSFLGNDTYTYSIGEHVIRNYKTKPLKTTLSNGYSVFIIDEINRGEISKIFGELFFSIDPGYRGKQGKVNTQYQNMVEEGDVFKDGFYVPENVYIIGTMNDIDRSVESMDFAMRRRFAWQEVTAEESYANMIENEAEFAGIKDEIKARMFNLNNAIAKTEGLNEAYQIGAAYFRNYRYYQSEEKPFECLWNNHLKGLLFEYLRGNRKAKELLEKLHKAYNKTSIDEQPAHTNEGQF